MSKKILITFLFSIVFFINSFSQTHTIDETTINITSNSNVNDFFKNTYYNAFDSVNVEWEIVENTMPIQWSFSNCFPNCYNPGVLSGSSTFSAGSQQYLNCHFYPNNTSGTGVVKMKITTNQTYIDTVTWIGVAESISSFNQIIDNSNNKISKIIDYNGRILNQKTPNIPHIVIYENGTIVKKFKTK
tara:strand:+ start:40 stop:600 length:561 start_codon:yes stop_codon:yes gene_type:complete